MVMSNRQTRPPTDSPEFRRYFEEEVRSSKGARDAARRMGYSAAKAVTYWMEKLGIEKPPSWGSRPPPRELDRGYFETAVQSSKNIQGAAQKLGYAAPKTVRYYLDKFGMKIPDHWYLRPNPRPSARGPEFWAYFEKTVNSSKDANEAAEKMGYASATTVQYHMKRLGIKTPSRWVPLPTSPEFQRYFEDVVDTSKSMAEAVQRLGYTRPRSVRYNLKRFGIKVPIQWYSSRDMRPSTKDQEFRSHFEDVIKTSWSLEEAAQRLGYAGPSSVKHHMNKLGIKNPDHWYGHPSAYGPDFKPYFEGVVKTSKTVAEAVQRMGFANASMIWHHLKRLEIEEPAEWGEKPGVSQQRKNRVPRAILKEKDDKAWVAALHQGEGCLTVRYEKRSDVTALALVVGMTDPAPIFTFCDLCGIGRPKRPYPRPAPYKPMWIGAISGLRAYRVVEEILPFLKGQKLEEATRACRLFAPHGYRKGRHSPYAVWPDDDFPLRKRGIARYAQRVMARISELGMQFDASMENRANTPRMDRTCLRISDVLLEKSPAGIGLVDIMDSSGVSWTATIRHLKHLADNSLVTKEKVLHPGKSGPRFLFVADHRLAELRELGWIPDAVAPA